MLNYILIGVFIIIGLFILLKIYSRTSGSILIKKFVGTKIFEYQLKAFRDNFSNLYNHQYLDIIFDDNSKVHMFGLIDDKSIIPLVSQFSNIDEDYIRADSMHSRIEMNEFVKNFEVHAIKNIEVIDNNGEPVEYSVIKGVKFDGDKQHISIALRNEKWINIKSVKFESTTDIDVSLFYHYY
jgi:hypothetical protein